MDIREFAFIEKQKEFADQEKPRQCKMPNDVHLVCKNCGQHDIRPSKNLYTGHVFDMECTYICTVCRGDMEVLNPNQDEEK